MLSFQASLDRLKHELRVSKDGEVAAMLGMTKNAFSERKKRESFPEREVVRLSAQNPELELDVTYVLTGERATSLAQQQFAVLVKAVLEMQPEGGLIADALPETFKRHGARRKRPEYLALIEVLDSCKESDLTLLTAIAVRLVRD